MILVIADIDPGRLYRVLAKVKTMEKAEKLIIKYTLEYGPTISIQLLNTGAVLEDPFNALGKRQLTEEAQPKDKTTQFKGLE